METMRLYSAGEITARLKGVTTRQILDISEKKLIVPARETTGAGSPRLYNFENIFDICLCLSIRGRIPAKVAVNEFVKNILQVIRDETYFKMSATEKSLVMGLLKPTFDILIISYNQKNEYSFFPSSYGEKLDKMQHIKKYEPQHFCSYVLEVGALYQYLRRIF